MRTFFEAFAAWFTTERRQAIQTLAASLAPLLVWIGFGDEAVWQEWVVLVGIMLSMIANLLNLLYLKSGEWGKGWAIIRGALYAAATAAVPSFVTLGVLTTEQGGWVIAGAGLALGALSSVVSILTSSQQQIHEIMVSMTELSREG